MVQRAGRSRRKRQYTCSICGHSGHNKATCQYNKSNEINNNKDCEEQMNENDKDEILYKDDMNFDNSEFQINIHNGDILLNLSATELKALESLSLEQLNLYQRYPVFHEFLLQIAKKKDINDIETLNGIYYSQWKNVKESILYETNDISDEIGLIQLI